MSRVMGDWPVTLDIIAKDPQTGSDRRRQYPWDERLLNNAVSLKNRLNKLYKRLPMNLQSSWQVTSAYRPGHYNTAAGGAPNSLHTTCQAVDLANISNVLGTWILEHPEVLEECQLWAEHPEATLTTQHLHLQTKPPRSGRRYFWP